MGIRERGNATPRHGEQFRVPAIPRSRDPAKRGDAVGTRAARIRVHFDHGAVEAHWRRAWEERGVYRTPVPSGRPKAYVLDFFPYPSGDGISVGHAKNYVPTDVLARYYRMRGHAVLHPMGWDAWPRIRRSEEHTSELQSRLHLVCRLLLEKKKKDIKCDKNIKRYRDMNS